MIFIDCFAYAIINLSQFVVHAWKWCSNWNEQSIQFAESQTHFSTSWYAKMGLTLTELI